MNLSLDISSKNFLFGVGSYGSKLSISARYFPSGPNVEAYMNFYSVIHLLLPEILMR